MMLWRAVHAETLIAGRAVSHLPVERPTLESFFL